MIACGLLREAELIGPGAVAADAVGYREALAYQNGWLTSEELRATLARATRRYAKRQLTWLRSEPNLLWIESGDLDALAPALREIGWLPAG
jgi:tRNA dimethylallyltransferase